MLIQHNGLTVTVDAPEGYLTFTDLLDAVCAAGAKGPVVVRRLRVNKRDIEPDSSHDSWITAGQVKSLEVWTVPIAEFLHESIADGIEMARKIRDGVKSDADLLRIGREMDASEHMVGVFDDLRLMWEFLVKVQTHLASIFKNGETLNLIGSRERFESICRQMETAQKAVDTIWLADLLEYELSPLVEDWITTMQRVRLKAGES